MIGIALDKPAFEAGAFLTGKIQWVGEPDRPASRIIVLMEWRTGGAGNVACGIPRFAQFALAKGQRDGVIPLRLLIPYEGPISFETEFITVSWKLRVRVDRKGLDETLDADFKVQPRR